MDKAAKEEIQKRYDAQGDFLKKAFASGNEKQIERAEGALARIIDEATKAGFILEDTRTVVPED